MKTTFVRSLVLQVDEQLVLQGLRKDVEGLRVDIDLGWIHDFLVLPWRNTVDFLGTRKVYANVFLVSGNIDGTRPATRCTLRMDTMNTISRERAGLVLVPMTTPTLCWEVIFLNSLIEPICTRKVISTQRINVPFSPEIDSNYVNDIFPVTHNLRRSSIGRRGIWNRKKIRRSRNDRKTQTHGRLSTEAILHGLICTSAKTQCIGF